MKYFVCFISDLLFVSRSGFVATGRLVLDRLVDFFMVVLLDLPAYMSIANCWCAYHRVHLAAIAKHAPLDPLRRDQSVQRLLNQFT